MMQMPPKNMVSDYNCIYAIIVLVQKKLFIATILVHRIHSHQLPYQWKSDKLFQWSQVLYWYEIYGAINCYLNCLSYPWNQGISYITIQYKIENISSKSSLKAKNIFYTLSFAITLEVPQKGPPQNMRKKSGVILE